MRISLWKGMVVATALGSVIMTPLKANAALAYCTVKPDDQALFDHVGNVNSRVSGSADLPIQVDEENGRISEYRIIGPGGYRTSYRLKDRPDNYIDIRSCSATREVSPTLMPDNAPVMPTQTPIASYCSTSGLTSADRCSLSVEQPQGTVCYCGNLSGIAK
jgi:hypothetical protein